MGKFLVRVTIVFTCIYFAVSFYVAQFLCVDILSDSFLVPFELITVVYCFSEGKYHCRFLKFSALAILLCDVLTRLDNHLDFLTVSAHNLIPISILALGVGTSTTLAIRHFIQVTRLKNARKTISNKKSGISHS